MSEMIDKLNETTLRVLRPMMTDTVIHPWLYNFIGYILMENGKFKIPHDDSCEKCKKAREIHTSWLEKQKDA